MLCVAFWDFLKNRTVHEKMTQEDLPETEYHKELKRLNTHPIIQWVEHLAESNTPRRMHCYVCRVFDVNRAVGGGGGDSVVVVVVVVGGGGGGCGDGGNGSCWLHASRACCRRRALAAFCFLRRLSFDSSLPGGTNVAAPRRMACCRSQKSSLSLVAILTRVA